MASSYRYQRGLPLRLWFALAATLLAFVVSLVASINLYLLEDGNALTTAAYGASSVLRFSYDGVYLSALVAGVMVCAIGVYALVQDTARVLLGMSTVALLIAFAGFGGLLVRHPISFLLLLSAFIALTALGLWLGRAVTMRFRRHGEGRFASLLGACMGAGSVLLVNCVALSIHTLALNPVSHALFMQGQVGATHFNSLVIALFLSLLTTALCVLSIGVASYGAR